MGIEHVAGVRLGDEVLGGPTRLVPVDPSTERPLAVVEGGDAEHARRAVARSRRAFPEWAATPAGDRATALRAAAAALRGDPADALAMLVSHETGKRLEEARAEVLFSAAFLDWFADAASDEPTHHASAGRRFVVSRKALGVVAALTPWNFPVSIPTRKVAAALACGCTVVLKPSELTPLSGLRLAEILEPHLPPGVLTTVAGNGAELSNALIDEPDVAVVTFTGSTRVGALVSARCAPSFTRVVLELGGRAPFIVLDDADVEAAVEILLVAKYRNNGASCISANNVFVHRSLYDDFLASYVDRSAGLRLGPPSRNDTELGPLITGGQASRVQGLVDDARRRGAHVFQADRPAVGHFVAPAVVEALSDMPLWEEEVFGPVTPVRPFDDEAAVLAEVNSWDYGLGGYVCGTDPARAAHVADCLDIGIVGVNNGAPNAPEVPFGGFKHSGIGREGGVEGLLEFTEAKTVSIAAP